MTDTPISCSDWSRKLEGRGTSDTPRLLMLRYRIDDAVIVVFYKVVFSIVRTMPGGGAKKNEANCVKSVALNNGTEI